MPMSHFYTPLNSSENLWFSDVFRGYRNETLTWKGLIYLQNDIMLESITSLLDTMVYVMKEKFNSFTSIVIKYHFFLNIDISIDGLIFWEKGPWSSGEGGCLNYLRITLAFIEDRTYSRANIVIPHLRLRRYLSSYRRYSVKKGFLKIWQYSQENIFLEVCFYQSCRP